MLAQSNPKPDDFIIGNYVHLLKPSDKEKGKFFCPICQGNDLSIALRGSKAKRAYTCYSSQCEGKKIAYELRRLNGEFNGKSKDSLHINKAAKIKNTEKVEDEQKEYKQISHPSKVLEFLRQKYDQSEISLNVRTKYIELQGVPLVMQTIRAHFAELHKVDIPRETLKECLLYLGKKTPYDPVKNYLIRCSIQNALIDHHFLDGLALKIFGCNKPLSQIYLRKFLIGAVSRVFDPGCKFDLTLVLYGKRGVGKTSFFNILGGSFYSGSMGKKLDKDDSLLALKYWILEWKELEGFTKREYNDNIKGFLSLQEDSFRVPYGDTVETFPRNFVFVGTCNEKNILVDPHGSRQFMFIPMTKRLDRQWLEENRDKIWAAAVALYNLQLETLQFSPEEETMQKMDNHQYEVGDYWLEVLEKYIDIQSEIPGMHLTTNELFDRLEDNGVKLARNEWDLKLLRNTLTKKGWYSDKKTVDGEQIRCWLYNG